DGSYDHRWAAGAAAGARSRRRGCGGVRRRHAPPVRRGPRGGRAAGGGDAARERVGSLAATAGSTAVTEAVIGKLAFGDRSDGVVSVVHSPSASLEALLAALPAARPSRVVQRAAE